MSNKYCLLTNDVETTSIWFNTLRDKTGMKVYEEGMPQLLDLYDKYHIKTTFFFTGYIATLIPDVVKIAFERGHEIGSHGYSHEHEDGFDILSFEEQVNHLIKSKEIIENIIREKIISFRSPALRVNQFTGKALKEAGFIIDSSIASQRFDMFMSFGSMQKIKWLFAPRCPYQSNNHSLHKKGNNGVYEIPISALILPYVGTTMRIFPGITNFQKRLLNYENLFHDKPIVFDIHPNELIDESNEKRTISKRNNNLIKYFLQDWLRSHLKIKNLGKNALKLYEDQIKYFKKKEYRFLPLKKYYEIKKDAA
ncbi:MAG: polysaccharide deacetylase family protein [bacterium]